MNFQMEYLPSRATYHYEHIHKHHVKHLNYLVSGTPFEKLPLEQIIAANRPAHNTGAYGKDENPLFHHASQVYNHNFAWLCMSPTPTIPSRTLVNAICLHFKSGDHFKRKWINTCRGVFGNGYMWLVEKDLEWHIVPSFGAGSPIGLSGVTPLLCMDLWEHAYLQDYGVDRHSYALNWMRAINWNFVESNYLQLRALDSPTSALPISSSDQQVIDEEIPDDDERKIFLAQILEVNSFAEYNTRRGAPVVTVGPIESGLVAPAPMVGVRFPKKQPNPKNSKKSPRS